MVVLDGKSLGFAPRTRVPVAPGKHKILFVTREGDERGTEATCAPGESKTVAVTFGELPVIDDLPELNPYP